jgi:hypothetical protein
MEDCYMENLSPKALGYIFNGQCDPGPGYGNVNLATEKLVRTIHVAALES